MTTIDYLSENTSDKIISAILNELQSLKGQNVFFIQVGGNDGIVADPISPTVKKLGWSGIIIEPVPQYYEKLKENYAGYERVDCLNIAIGQKGEQTIYFANEKYVERERRETGEVFSQGVASFNREHLLDFGLSPDDIGSINVPVDTLASVLNEKKPIIDLLVIDVEGAELSVLKSMDWSKSVETIVFESDHMRNDDRIILNELLEASGYSVFWKWPDSFAVKKSNRAILGIFERLDRLKYEFFSRNSAQLMGRLEFKIEPNATSSHILDTGWSPPETHGAWNNAEIATLMVPIPSTKSNVSAMELSVSAYTPFGDQTISISSQHSELGTYSIKRQGFDVTHSVLTVPLALGHLLDAGFLELRIWIHTTVRPWKHGLGEDRRPLGLALTKLRLLE